MELRDYLKVVTKNALLILIVTLVAVGSGYLVLSQQPTRYTSGMAIIVNYQEKGTASTSGYFKYNNYYGNLIAASFNESISGLMKNAGLVQAVFENASISFADKKITNAGKYFRPIPKSKNVTEVRFTADSAEEAQALSTSLIALLDTKSKEFVQSQGEGSLELGVEGPVIEKEQSQLALYLILLSIVGFGFGIFLAFFLTYIKDCVSSPEEFQKILSSPLWSEIRTGAGDRALESSLVPLREKILGQFPLSSHKEVSIGIISLKSNLSLQVEDQLASALKGRSPVQSIDLTERSESAAEETLKNTKKNGYFLVALPTFDSLHFSQQVLSRMDGVILVAEADHTPRRCLSIAASQLAMVTSPKGIVLT